MQCPNSADSSDSLKYRIHSGSFSGLAPLEFPHALRQRMLACLRIAQPGERARFHRVEMRGERWRGYAARAGQAARARFAASVNGP